ncbi:MAG: cation:dicarboxylase symporter family transporter [Verrucomicrobia bacterium]|nr:cation:dicarboxylase symporter family transporter [Verrucomicrobiota bacterium]
MVHSKLGYEALLAILFGIAIGLFFGPLCNILKPVGDIFVFTLQMVVIPYIPSLLMHGLGSLSPELAKKLFKKGWLVLTLLWFIVLVVCYMMKALIPTPLPNPDPSFSLEQAASIPGSTSLLIPGTKLNMVFYNVVPIITAFSLIFGLALMHLKEKDPLLSLFERINGSLERIIKWITIVSPIGIFAHVAYVMGTVNFDDLAKLQLYLGIIIATTLLLSLWVLPIIVSCLTAIPYRDLFREYKIVGFLPFATAIPTIALPYINNAMRRLAERKNLELATFKGTSQTIVPIGFGFAQLGNFLPLLFIFFLSFFYRHPLTDLQAIAVPLLVAIFSLGTPQFSFVALPFLLSTLSLPAQGFSLYAEISAITLNFQVLLSTVSMLSFMYLVVLRYYGLLVIEWRRLAFHIGCILALFVAVIAMGKKFIHTEDNYQDLYYSLKMDKVIENPPPVTIYTHRIPPPTTHVQGSTMGRILERGAIRVGYDTRDILFCYLNKWNELVGYDVAYAYQLAKDLDVKLELVPINYDTLIQDVESGYCDIVMSAIIMDETRILSMGFSNPYLEQFNVLVVPLKEADKYRNLEHLQQNTHFKIGALGAYKEVVAQHFPDSTLIVGSSEDMLQGKFDAYVWGELQANVWCLLHPEFIVLPYQGKLGKKYFAYPTQREDEQLVHFLNEWLQLKQEQGFELKQRQYWFLGKLNNPEAQRWSVIRNVLHWVD